MDWEKLKAYLLGIPTSDELAVWNPNNPQAGLQVTPNNPKAKVILPQDPQQRALLMALQKLASR